MALYLVAVALAPREAITHVHTVLDLARLAGPWALLAVPAAVALRALALGAALDVTGALTGWGVRFGPRVAAAVAAEVVFALNAVAEGIALARGLAAPPLSLASALPASARQAGEWAHALPQMVGLEDLVAVGIVALVWARLEERTVGGTVGRTATAYGASLLLLTGVLTLGAL